MKLFFKEIKRWSKRKFINKTLPFYDPIYVELCHIVLLQNSAAAIDRVVDAMIAAAVVDAM